MPPDEIDVAMMDLLTKPSGSGDNTVHPEVEGSRRQAMKDTIAELQHDHNFLRNI